MEEKAKQLSHILKTISNANRLMILCVLEEGELSVGSICEQIPNISVAAVSQHLTALKLSGMVTSEKRGLHMYYRICDDRVIEMMKALKTLYCK